MRSNILLTGSTGFLGRQLVKSLQGKAGINLIAALRRFTEISASHVVCVHGLDASTDWSAAVDGQNVVIHAAARAHVIKDEVADPLAEDRRVNADGTLNLVRQAASS